MNRYRFDEYYRATFPWHERLKISLYRNLLVAPYCWLCYKTIYNPIKLVWHKYLPEPLKERIRHKLGWRTWAEHHRQQEELRRKYE